MKKAANISIFCFVSFFIFSSARSDDFFDDLSDFDMDLSVVDEFDKKQKTRRVQTSEESNLINIFEILSGSIGAAPEYEFQPGVVKDPLWFNTKAPSGRDILYLLPYKISSLQKGGFAFNLFFNMTDNMNVGVKSLLNPEALDGQLLPMVIEELTRNNFQISLNEAGLTSLMALFKKITLQERKFGGVFQAGFVKGPFTVQINTSLHLAERNFWLNQADRKSISSLLNTEGGSFSDDELVRFRHGMGDTRVKVGLNTLNMSNLQIDVGFEVIVPTSRFSYSSRYKTTSNNNIDTAESFGNDIFNVLKGVRDYLINPRLGNSGHFGFGCYLESKINVFRNLASIWTRVSYDRLMPGEEDRLVLHRPTATARDVASSIDRAKTAIDNVPYDVVDADYQDLEFNSQIAMSEFRQKASDFVRQYIFPSVYRTTSYPGGVVNAVLAISTDIKRFRCSVGYDFYLQQSEKIKKIHNTDVTLDQLRIEDAQSSLSYQHKVFAEALYLKNFKRCEMSFGLGGDATVARNGIGMDWTAYAKLMLSF